MEFQKGDTSPIIQPAATIMLLRQHPQNGIESLLLKRNEALKFAPGYWVFPGGKVELNELESHPNIFEAARAAATRETFEETGISVNQADLFHYVHWTTPLGGSRRYGTWFFYVWVDTDVVSIDQSEIVDYKWASPHLAFNLMHSAAIKILPPTYVSLLRISPFSNQISIDQELQSGTPAVIPRTTFKQGLFYSFYKGDVAYTAEEEPDIDGPRHRIIGDFKKGTYTFQYEGCDHIFPVTGRSVLNVGR